MAQEIKQANIFGRIGSGLGQGLGEQLPKEIERGRLSSGLENLNKQQNLSPQEYFTKALSIPGLLDRPQVIQSLENLARQRAVMNSVQQQQQNVNNQLRNPAQNQRNIGGEPSGYSSATTKEGVKATLNPYIPPSGPEIENMARQKLANEPYIYPNIESARSAVNNEIAANTAQSNAQINKRNLQQDVQTKAQKELKDEIATRGANIPGRMMSNLQKQAIQDVKDEKLTENEAGIEYGKQAEKIDRDLSKVRGWGGIDLITNKPKDLFSSVRAIREKYPEREDRRDLAEIMVGENGLSPQFAFGLMMPVNETPELNKELKSLPNIKPRIEKAVGLPGLAGLGFSKPKSIDPISKTREISPKLLKSMGTTGSPLAAMYELEKKGYSPDEFKSYLLDHKKQLTEDQYDELGLTQKGFSGLLNDIWFRSFTGIK